MRTAVDEITERSDVDTVARDPLGNTCGTAAAGALIVFAVARRAGDAEQLRDLLAGEEVDLEAAARIGLASGYRLAHVLGVTIAVLAVAASIFLRRRMAERHDHQPLS